MRVFSHRHTAENDATLKIKREEIININKANKKSFLAFFGLLDSISSKLQRG